MFVQYRKSVVSKDPRNHQRKKEKTQVVISMRTDHRRVATVTTPSIHVTITHQELSFHSHTKCIAPPPDDSTRPTCAVPHPRPRAPRDDDAPLTHIVMTRSYPQTP